MLARDTKNVYKPALAGAAMNVVGLDIPYEEPRNADIVLDSAHATPDAMIERLWTAIEIPFLTEGPWGALARRQSLHAVEASG